MESFKVADPMMSLERDVLVYRAYLALRKWRVVLEEVSSIM